LNSDSKFAKINQSCNKLARWNYRTRRWWVRYAWRIDVVFHTRTNATYNITSAKNLKTTYKVHDTFNIKIETMGIIYYENIKATQ